MIIPDQATADRLADELLDRGEELSAALLAIGEIYAAAAALTGEQP